MGILISNYNSKRKAFIVKLGLNLLGESSYIDAIIDTGCTSSLITARDMVSFERTLYECKRGAVLRNREVRKLKGVTWDGKIEDFSNLSMKDKLSRKDIVFKYSSIDLDISGIVLSNKNVWVSYNSYCTSLIGLELLDNFNIYVGYDTNGTYKLVACLKGDKESELEFYNFLEDNFDLVHKPRLLARLFRKDY